MIVIDFSTKPLRLIDKDLQYIKKFYFIFIIIIAVILFILMIFIFYDTKRERKVHRLLDELRELNENLKEKVKEEVKKSIEKDKQLIMQSRLALMGELLSMIAHQWRQPLNAIGSVVTNIEVDMEFNELNKKKLAKSIEKIKTTIQYLSETIDEFRRFYRKDMKKEDINIDESIKEVINLILPSLESKNIKINFNKRCNKKIKLMKNEFKQVILNIIKNAEDAIIQRNVKNPNIWIRTFVEEGKCVIEISDNAGGIDKKVRDKIFEPYFTTKNEKEGTGLGLYMSKNIVEKRLGGVLMQYNDEKGAVFRMEFEVCDVVERNN
jgi:signal transduction histidine kinase